jgi:hypothetical protein
MTIYTASAAALSWIDARTGLPEVDLVAPGAAITQAKITCNLGYRFASFLDVSIELNETTKTIAGHAVLPMTGIYRAPSYWHLPSWKFPVDTKVATGQEPITFTQVTGARTISPEIIGAGGGVAAGAAAGAGIGVWFLGWGALPGAAIGGIIGGLTGEAVAHDITGFPPIWSEIKISIFNDGRITYELLPHSLFPSLTFFTPAPKIENTYVRTPVNATGLTYYDGMPNLNRWKTEGWGPIQKGSVSGPTPGNPWNDVKGVF